MSHLHGLDVDDDQSLASGTPAPDHLQQLQLMRVLAAALTIGLSLICLIGTARAQVAGRLIDAVDANERGNHIDISIIFGCGLQYISHTPASEGDTLRLRFAPLPDCGSLVGTLSSPPLDGITQSARSRPSNWS
jgi:hypothetical protein